MTPILNRLRNEPAMLVSTVLAFLAYLGVTVSEQDASTITQLVTVLGPIVAGVLIRQQVTPNSKVVVAER